MTEMLHMSGQTVNDVLVGLTYKNTGMLCSDLSHCSNGRIAYPVL